MQFVPPKVLSPPLVLFEYDTLLVIKDPVTRRETIAWIRGELKRDKCNSDVVSPLILHPAVEKALNHFRHLSGMMFELLGAHCVLSFKTSGNPEPYKFL